MKSLQKHVIFLGAGASASSGYPLADALRLRLSSAKQLISDFEQLTKNSNPALTYKPMDQERLGERKICKEIFEQFQQTIEQFRHGGFGSVDEFSKLASTSAGDQFLFLAQEMKKLMKLALSLHNPELIFEKSDYYPFVQRLFDENKMSSLKHSITIISYNYDCYLEYLLLKAQAYRNRVAGREPPNDGLKNRLSSGFFKPSDLDGLKHPDQQFKHFKLHGSITYADDISHGKLFKTENFERLINVNIHKNELPIPPVVFPWELFDQDGAFIDKEAFIFCKNTKVPEEKAQALLLYALYKTIWEGAREAVQNAKKISFVGLSMHDYLDAGLRYLFQNKTGPVDIVVANPINEQFIDQYLPSHEHPGSPCEHIANLFQAVARGMAFSDNARAFDGVIDGKKRIVRTRNSFREFIAKEMNE
jgi:hypothetical protein